MLLWGWCNSMAWLKPWKYWFKAVSTLVESRGPWCITFVLWWLKNLSFFIEVICWAPGFNKCRALGSLQIFLRAQPCRWVVKDHFLFILIIFPLDCVLILLGENNVDVGHFWPIWDLRVNGRHLPEGNEVRPLKWTELKLWLVGFLFVHCIIMASNMVRYFQQLIYNTSPIIMSMF